MNRILTGAFCGFLMLTSASAAPSFGVDSWSVSEQSSSTNTEKQSKSLIDQLLLIIGFDQSLPKLMITSDVAPISATALDEKAGDAECSHKKAAASGEETTKSTGGGDQEIANGPEPILFAF